MKKVLIILALALCYPSLLNCQVNHSVWYGDFEVRSNSFLLPVCVNAATGVVQVFTLIDLEEVEIKPESLNGFNKYWKWLAVSPSYDIHVPKWRVYGPDGEIPTQGPDWWRCLLFGDFRHNYNFSLGYNLHWRSYDIPFGANFGVNYEWRGVCIKEGDLAGLHKTSGVVPSATISWYVLGNDFERKHKWNIVAKGGASYVKTLFYNDPLLMGKDKVNGGWRGVLAIGFSINRTALMFKYEWDCFDYFNNSQINTKMNNLVIEASMRMY
ncbi:MAG: hypothetical protein IJK78_05735 [Bacteroidales bacterium]|nr:hypothetical protein [Bacteroidales bacterium]